MPYKVFSDQKCTKCRLAVGLHPDPLGELIQCFPGLAALKLLAPSVLDPTAPRLTPSALGDRTFPLFFVFFPFEHCSRLLMNRWGADSCIPRFNTQYLSIDIPSCHSWESARAVIACCKRPMSTSFTIFT